VTGLLYGGNANQLVAQLKGSATIIVFTAAAGLLVMFSLKALGMLRISEAGEPEGLDIHEHGAPAYHPEPSYEGYSPIPSVRAGNGGSQPQEYQPVSMTERSAAGPTATQEAEGACWGLLAFSSLRATHEHGCDRRQGRHAHHPAGGFGLSAWRACDRWRAQPSLLTHDGGGAG
jgi:hypothetical protein